MVKLFNLRIGGAILIALFAQNLDATLADAEAKKQTPSIDASTLPTPKGEPILTVSGKISKKIGSGKSATFDIKSLEALGVESFTTKTPWYEKPIKVEGVPLKKVLEAVGAELKGTKIRVIAANDYSADLPIEDAFKNGALLALKRDGEYMPLYDKGPIFVMFNFDARPHLNNKMYWGRSVWQVIKIQIK